MRPEPESKRAIIFVDGQNLFAAIKDCFGYTYPNYDIKSLAWAVAGPQGWTVVETRFYTGIPNAEKDPFWHGFWKRKLTAMERANIRTYARELRYRRKAVRDAQGIPVLDLQGQQLNLEVRQEKGVDMRIALDIVRLAQQERYDVAILFSQDQDFTEVAKEIRSLAREQDRWIKIASAFPTDPSRPYSRGIDRTDWLPFDRTTYDACIDPMDYGTPMRDEDYEPTVE